MCTPNSPPPSITVSIIFFITSACLCINNLFLINLSKFISLFILFLPARVNRSHRRTRYMRVSLHRHCLLSMILANIFVHLFYVKRLPILMCKINNTIDLESDAIIQQFKKSEKNNTCFTSL